MGHILTVLSAFMAVLCTIIAFGAKDWPLQPHETRKGFRMIHSKDNQGVYILPWSGRGFTVLAAETVYDRSLPEGCLKYVPTRSICGFGFGGKIHFS